MTMRHTTAVDGVLGPEAWVACWRALGAQGDGLSWHERLLAAYAEPQRHYHTQQHLAECLTGLQEALAAPEPPAVQAPAEIAMALWFHDAVYGFGVKDNEQRSAALAVSALQSAGVAADGVARVAALVLATQHTAAPTTLDEQLLVDLDLAILGASPERFAQYEQQIRQEYAWVPEATFREARARVLQGFIDRPVLYHTPWLRTQYEAQARANLRCACSFCGFSL